MLFFNVVFFKNFYQINSLLSWTIKITDKLKSSCLSEEKELWLEFEDRVLLSDSSLKELYSSLNERRGEETRSTESVNHH